MTLVTLVIDIACGEKTCASAPGKFCKYLGSRKFGQMPVCMLFAPENPRPHQSASTTELEEVDGWVQRCEACLKASSLYLMK